MSSSEQTVRLRRPNNPASGRSSGSRSPTKRRISGTAASIRQFEYRASDPWLLAVTCILLCLSALMVYSTTALPSEQAYGTTTWMIKRHLAHMFVGLIGLGFFACLHPKHLYRIAPMGMLLAIILLIGVLIPGLGYSAGGAQRWIQLGVLRMQPGEFTKLALIVYFAAYIERHHVRMHRFKTGVLVPCLFLTLVGVLLLLEPDFGSTAVVCAVVFSQLFTAARLWHLVTVGICGAAAGTMLVLTSPYRFKRLVTFLDPFHDPSSAGYQLIQSLVAVGSGGIQGAGLGAGKQKLFYLPAAHTDFIFAVIAEELGSVGAVFVLILFLLILWRGLRICSELAEHPFYATLALGCTLLLVLPALLNMGVVLGLLPTKGLVLPLVAYGGTGMVIYLAAMGMLIRLSRMAAE